jgi:hypothetical protein
MKEHYILFPVNHFATSMNRSFEIKFYNFPHFVADKQRPAPIARRHSCSSLNVQIDNGAFLNRVSSDSDSDEENQVSRFIAQHKALVFVHV